MEHVLACSRRTHSDTLPTCTHIHACIHALTHALYMIACLPIHTRYINMQNRTYGPISTHKYMPISTHTHTHTRTHTHTHKYTNTHSGCQHGRVGTSRKFLWRTRPSLRVADYTCTFEHHSICHDILGTFFSSGMTLRVDIRTCL
jgi:hypothetical protein